MKHSRTRYLHTFKRVEIQTNFYTTSVARGPSPPSTCLKLVTASAVHLCMWGCFFKQFPFASGSYLTSSQDLISSHTLPQFT